MTQIVVAPAIVVVHQPSVITLHSVGPFGCRIRFSDNGAGGRFGPLVPGTGGRSTVAYTATTEGPIRISTEPPTPFCVPNSWFGVDHLVHVGDDGRTFTANEPIPSFGYLQLDSGTYQIISISGPVMQLDRPCSNGRPDLGSLKGNFLQAAHTGGTFVLQAQRSWPCGRVAGTVFGRPTSLTAVTTGRRSNIYYANEPITLRAKKGTSVTHFSVRDLWGREVASGPLNPAELRDASTDVAIQRCGYYLADFFSDIADPTYGACVGSAPLLLINRSSSGLMECAPRSSKCGDFSDEAVETSIDLIQWLTPRSPKDVPWYVLATGQWSTRSTGLHQFRITMAVGGCRLTLGGSVIADSLHDPTLSGVAVSDAVYLRAGDRHDVILQCSGAAPRYRPLLEMSDDGGLSWRRFLIDQFPTADAKRPVGLTLTFLKNTFPYSSHREVDLFTNEAIGLKLERFCLNNTTSPESECDEFERIIDAWLALTPKRPAPFVQFTTYRVGTRLSEAALRGTTIISVQQTPFGVGAKVRVDDELHEVRSTAGNRVTLTAPLLLDRAAGTIVQPDTEIEDAAVTRTVRRFAGKVSIWECTNEPDQSRPAEHHAVFMRSFYRAVKAAAPGEQSLVLGPSTTSVNHELEPGGYIDVLATKGCLSFIDAFAFHAYNLMDGEYLQACRSLEKLHGFLNARGLGHLPLYQTEQGYQADLYGVFEPWHQANWLMTHRLAFDRYGIPLDRDYYWTARSHGDPMYETFLEDFFNLPAPGWLLLRTYSDVLDGAHFAESYDLGSAEDLFVASRYAGPGGSVAVFWSPGNPDASLDLDVTGTGQLQVVDGWGNRQGVPVVDGRATLTGLSAPAYVRLGQDVELKPVIQRWGEDLARSGAVSGPGAGAELSKMINGSLPLSYFNGTIPYSYTGERETGPIMPVVLTLRWTTVQTIARILIRCPSPWQSRGSLLEYDLQWESTSKEWTPLVPLVSRIPRVEAILQPAFSSSVRDFWDRKHVFHHRLHTSVNTCGIRLRIFAASWGGEACQVSVEAGGQGSGTAAPQISEWQVYGPDDEKL